MMTFVDDGMKLMIKNNWVEQPPMAVRRIKLIQVNQTVKIGRFFDLYSKETTLVIPTCHFLSL